MNLQFVRKFLFFQTLRKFDAKIALQFLTPELEPTALIRVLFDQPFSFAKKKVARWKKYD